jgi:uncharacterized membrane protein
MAEAKDKSWSVTLTPHRSLGRQGFLVLFAVVVALNLVIAIFFFILKAWPVFGFLGLDVGLVWVAFRANENSAKQSERILIEGDDLRLIRQRAKTPTQEKSFNRRWTKVLLEYDEAREMVGRLFLVSRGERTEIASFLGADERQSLANELKSVMAIRKI